MRIVVFILTLGLFAASYAQVPDYFANDPKWVCGNWNSNQWNPPYIPLTSNYVYYLNGDTIIGGNTFHRLFSRGETTYAGPLPSFNFDNFTGYFLRQDNRSIRYFTNQIGIDSLLVSYDYQVGDTVRGDIFQACYFQDTIQKIDSVLINSEYRRVFYLDSINGPIITEGIGYQVLLNDPSGEFIFPLCQGIGFSYFIFCYGTGAQPYWDWQGTGGNCILNLNLEEYEATEMTVFPNPFDLNLNVKSFPVGVSEIRLFDVSSRLLNQWSFESETQIEMHDLESGIYFYEIRHENKISRKGKIIKSR